MVATKTSMLALAGLLSMANALPMPRQLSPSAGALMNSGLYYPGSPYHYNPQGIQAETSETEKRGNHQDDTGNVKRVAPPSYPFSPEFKDLPLAAQVAIALRDAESAEGDGIAKRSVLPHPSIGLSPEAIAAISAIYAGEGLERPAEGDEVTKRHIIAPMLSYEDQVAMFEQWGLPPPPRPSITFPPGVTKRQVAPGANMSYEQIAYLYEQWGLPPPPRPSITFPPGVTKRSVAPVTFTYEDLVALYEEKGLTPPPPTNNYTPDALFKAQSGTLEAEA